MTIPSLHLDNPIQLEAVPDQQLSIQLPAFGFPQELGQLKTTQNFLVTIAITAIVPIVGAFILLYGGFSQLTSFLGCAHGLSVVALAISIAIRPTLRQSLAGNFNTVLAALMVVTLTTLELSFQSYDGKAQIIVFVELIALLAMELGFYFRTLAFESVLSDQKTLLGVDRSFRDLISHVAGGLFLFAVLGLLLSPLLAIWGVSILAFGLGFHQLKQRYRNPWKAFTRAIENYVYYPSEAELAPGQIATPAGHFISRAVLIGIVIGAAFPSAFFEFTRHQIGATIGWIFAPIALIYSIYILVVGIVGSTIDIGDRTKAWQAIVKKMRQSPNKIERNAIFMGYVASDHSPTLIDRSLCSQHIHILGATGTNKSSVGLAPLIEQLISFGDASVFVIDLKADSPELYYAAETAVKDYRATHNTDIPLKVFSLENGSRSHLFNPFLTSGWTRLSILERTDILCTSCGLAYGFEYAKSFFTSANSAVLRESNLLNPNAMSFRQLYVDVARLLRADDGRLLPELRRAGVHVMEVIGRLASYEELNIVPSSGYDDSIIENQIQLADYFQKPGVAYFKLPSTTASIGAPSIARLILYFLIIAGKTAERKTKIHVIIDEFQRMASENLDQMLQMARSHDINLVLCNQSLSDLHANSPKVFHAVDGNCGIRQWFSISSTADLQMVEHLMGTREDIEVTESRSNRETTKTYRTVHVPRARVTDLQTISENPALSILQIGGSGRGYARYHGIPFVAYSSYHISAAEYERRKRMPWPSELEGMFEAKEQAQADPYAGKTPKGKAGEARKKQRDDERKKPPQDGWDQDLFS